jgi:nicotinamidase-related amidase
MSLHDRYAVAGFGASITRGRRPAVVVVDFTRGFTEPEFATGADMSEEVYETARLVQAARDAGAPVVFTAIAYGSPVEGRVWHQKAPGMATLLTGSAAVELDPRLDRRSDEPLVVKHGASAFFGTGLAPLLVGLGVDTVVICGATTSGCVRATAVDAVQYGFPVLVPRECVADRAREPHEASLFDLQAKYADVVPVDDVSAYLAATPQGAPVPVDA